MREIVGQKTYEYTNHLGNVLLTTSDKKLKQNDAYLFIPTWTDVSNMNITSTTLTNTSSTLGWTDPGECYSVQGITGDGYVEHTLNANPYYSRNVGVGLSYSNGTGHALNTIDYCIWQAWTGQQLQVRVGGSIVYSVPGSFSGSQVIRIERVGSTIYFKVDGTTVYSTTEYGSGTLYADVAISRPGQSVQDLKIGGGTNDLSVSADVRSWSDYYPYGMPMVGRNTNLSDYRFAFNGAEMDNEVSGNGNSYTTPFRQYNPRLARWASIDPVHQPWQSPYSAFDGNPIYYADPSGAIAEVKDAGGGTKGTGNKGGSGTNGTGGSDVKTFKDSDGNTWTNDPDYKDSDWSANNPTELDAVDIKPSEGVSEAPTPKDAPEGKADPPTTIDPPSEGSGGSVSVPTSLVLNILHIYSILKSLDDAQNHPDDHTDRDPAITGVHGQEPVGGGHDRNVHAKGSALTDNTGINPGANGAKAPKPASGMKQFYNEAKGHAKFFNAMSEGWDAISEGSVSDWRIVSS